MTQSCLNNNLHRHTHVLQNRFFLHPSLPPYTILHRYRLQTRFSFRPHHSPLTHTIRSVNTVIHHRPLSPQCLHQFHPLLPQHIPLTQSRHASSMRVTAVVRAPLHDDTRTSCPHPILICLRTLNLRHRTQTRLPRRSTGCT